MAEESRHRLAPKAIVFLLALAAVAVGGAIFAACSSGSSTSTQSAGGGSPPGVGRTPTAQPTPKTVTIDPGTNPSKGPADAKLTIVEFSDFQSPQCGAFAQQTLPQIFANYGDKVRFVFMNVIPPNELYAEKAAEAGECANAQGSFWPYHDLLFQNQQILTGLLTSQPTGGVAKVVDTLKSYAGQLGLDTATFNDCLDSGEMAVAVQADMAVAGKAANDAGLTSFGLPSFFINGNYIHGSKSYDVFKQMIDAALAAAK